MKYNLTPIATMLACLILVPAYGQYGGRPPGMGGPPPGPQFSGSTAKLFGDNASFSATMELQGESGAGSQAMSGKIAVDQGKSRFEMNMGAADPHMKAMGMDQMVMVTRPDRKVSYMMFPNQQAYVENPIPDTAAAKPQSDYKVEITELGKETVDGHPCVKNKAVVTDDQGNKSESIVWNATDLKNFPVKIEMTQEGHKSTMLFKDVKLGKQDASQFEPPAGHKKYDSMMSLMMEKMGGGMGAPPQNP
jgi:outer membrane lipoprotein-sorting protein